MILYACSDIDCGQGGARCRTCGDIGSIEASCRSNPSCVAFTYDNSCGFLKSSAGPLIYREGYTTFTLTDKGAAPAAAPTAAPAALPAAAAPAVTQPPPAAAAPIPVQPQPNAPIQVAATVPQTTTIAQPSPSPSPSPLPAPSPSPLPPPSPRLNTPVYTCA
uniref:Uncharacterized protein n=1 Tax=Tetradesmus obliquus TaxID=3088 RepID=A0A383VI36_TETOB|eukprot:jgi/Sobl393_1/19982/SZX64603.1